MNKTTIRCTIFSCLVAMSGAASAAGTPDAAPASQGVLLDSLRATIMSWAQHSGGKLNVASMFLSADIVVKVVMVLLAFASLVTWVIFIAKLLDLRVRTYRLRRNYVRLDKTGTLNETGNGNDAYGGVVAAMVKAARRECERSKVNPAMKAGIKERVSSELARIETGAARSMNAGTGILANIGSTGPFIGLFGTVWGIMNSFISIAETNTTNLAVVAPGIAEALLATAIGLVAAIPAVIFYNVLTRALGGYKVMIGDAGSLVERTLSRDLDLAPAKPEPVRLAEAAE
jgi:biopolymer transport protein ExbB